jgi:transcriptional regulator with XRE-family HTH domain
LDKRGIKKMSLYQHKLLETERKARRLSQEVLAEQVKTSRPTLIKVLKGECNDIDLLHRVATFLGFTLARIFEGV